MIGLTPKTAMPSIYLAGSGKIYGKLQLWWRAQIIREVPSESAFCEFGCREIQCTLTQWLHCADRLSDIARTAHSAGASPRLANCTAAVANVRPALGDGAAPGRRAVSR